MKIKHKVIKEFQYLSPDKKIFILKLGTILEDYIYKVKTELIPIDKDIIDNNPDFFILIDWKAELITYLKTNKIPQPAVLSKKLFPFVEELLVNNSSIKEEVVFKEKIIFKEKVIKEDINDFQIKELEKREKKVISDEEDIELRLRRIEKREEDYKKDSLLLKQKEDDLIDKVADLDSITERESKLKDHLDFKSEVEEYNEYLISKLEETFYWWSQVEPLYIHLERLGIPRFPTVEYKEIKKTS
jgi:hypothetical protein